MPSSSKWCGCSSALGLMRPGFARDDPEAWKWRAPKADPPNTGRSPRSATPAHLEPPAAHHAHLVHAVAPVTSRNAAADAPVARPACLANARSMLLAPPRVSDERRPYRRLSSRVDESFVTECWPRFFSPAARRAQRRASPRLRQCSFARGARTAGVAQPPGARASSPRGWGPPRGRPRRRSASPSWTARMPSSGTGTPSRFRACSGARARPGSTTGAGAASCLICARSTRTKAWWSPGRTTPRGTTTRTRGSAL